MPHINLFPRSRQSSLGTRRTTNRSGVSNNPQPVFSPPDPFRRLPVAPIGVPRTKEARPGLQIPQAGSRAVTDLVDPGAQPRFPPISVGFGDVPDNAAGTLLRRTETEPLANRPLFAAALAAGIPQTTGPAADAARTLAPAFRNNPFITPMGLARLSKGRAPLINEIDPAFFRQTSPVLVNALLGLFRSLGQPIEDTEFAIDQFRPTSFR